MALSANIEGVPTPKVSWFHNGEPIKPANGTSVDTKDTFTSLTIKGSTGKNSGKYKVVAENVVGKDEKEFDVTIRGITPYSLQRSIREYTPNKESTHTIDYLP